MEFEKIFHAGVNLGALFCIFVVGCFCIYDRIFVSQHRKSLAAYIDKINDLHATVKGIESTVNLLAGNSLKLKQLERKDS